MIRTAAVFVLVLVCSLAPAESLNREGEAARKFVQSFYDWYVPQTSKPESELLALRTKRSLFTPQLRNALLEDWRAQAKVSDMIVGLDGDPFLNSQDPGDPYVAVSARAKGRVWLVPVHLVRDGKRSKAPQVIAAVERVKTGWRFTNFLFPDGNDLLSVLKELQKEREKPAQP
jgi:hypothetical protein